MGDWIQLGEYALARLFDDGVLHIRDDSQGFVALAQHEVACLRALLERKAAEPDGKPDPAPVASEPETIEKVIDLMGALKSALKPKDRP